jgi:hypothetical protein
MGGKPSVPKTTAQDMAILDLKLQRDKLRQYQKKLQVVLDKEHEIAKQHLSAGRKDRAILALRQRKYQQGLLHKTDAQLENLEQLVRSWLASWAGSLEVCALGFHHRVLLGRSLSHAWAEARERSAEGDS